MLKINNYFTEQYLQIYFSSFQGEHLSVQVKIFDSDN